MSESEPESQSEPDKRHEAFLEKLWEGRQANYEQQDKALLTLSSGALAVSIAFLKDLVPFPPWYLLTFLILSWILFSAAIISTVLSYLASDRAHEKQLLNYEEHLKGNEDAMDDKNNPARLWTARLNRAAACFFIAAVFTTMWFVIGNTLRSMEMSNKRLVPDDKKGISPPTLPKREPVQQPSPTPPKQEPAKK